MCSGEHLLEFSGDLYSSCEDTTAERKSVSRFHYRVAVWNCSRKKLVPTKGVGNIFNSAQKSSSQQKVF